MVAAAAVIRAAAIIAAAAVIRAAAIIARRFTAALRLIAKAHPIATTVLQITVPQLIGATITVTILTTMAASIMEVGIGEFPFLPAWDFSRGIGGTDIITPSHTKTFAGDSFQPAPIIQKHSRIPIPVSSMKKKYPMAIGKQYLAANRLKGVRYFEVPDTFPKEEVRNDTSEKVDFFFSVGFNLACGRGYSLGSSSGGAGCLCARRSKRLFPGSLRGRHSWIVPWQER